jgi:hypothetical protein
MATTNRTTAVGVFADRTHAEHAVEQLRRSGFTPEQIGFVVPDAPSQVEVPPLDRGTKAGEGAATGLAAGAALGGLVGAALATVIIPGVGPVIASGLLAAVLTGAAAGAASGGMLGALIGLDVPEEEAHHYQREFHSGRSLVTVRAGERYDEAVAILQQAAEWQDPRAHHAGRLAERNEGDTGDPGSDSVVAPRV